MKNIKELKNKYQDIVRFGFQAVKKDDEWLINAYSNQMVGFQLALKILGVKQSEVNDWKNEELKACSPAFRLRDNEPYPYQHSTPPK